MLLSACGSSTLTGLDIFTNDITVSGQAISLGTLGSSPVTIQFDNSFGDDDLYAYMPIAPSAMNSSRLNAVADEDYIVFFLEKGEGTYDSGDTVFNFETDINLTSGTASPLEEINDIEGTSTATQKDLAQDFVDFVAEESKVLIDLIEKANDETENYIVSKL